MPGYLIDLSAAEANALSDLAADQAAMILDAANNRVKIIAKDSAGDSITTYLRPSKRYVANLTQSSTGAPVATVLENDLSAVIVFARTSAGLYTGTLVAAFTAGKTIILFGTPIHVNNMGTVEVVQTSADVFTFTTLDYKTSDDTSAPLDGMLTNTSLIIEVYP